MATFPGGRVVAGVFKHFGDLICCDRVELAGGNGSWVIWEDVIDWWRVVFEEPFFQSVRHLISVVREAIVCG